jgi:hypothetical protein
MPIAVFRAGSDVRDETDEGRQVAGRHDPEAVNLPWLRYLPLQLGILPEDQDTVGRFQSLWAHCAAVIVF